ncbi:zinc finger CCHC domain-containing protein 2-like isoform X3 [Anguilla anguilla]|uniref:zinc finger CCHC domain-containing protein 2-like isoform X3 n=1 Tax=Anguilla anguilla TaxID=7936 RepID=UPI0015AFBC1F|nr:zinc finger CCHC domain-containing protein 2-like isoform X3 [Anguilla anguilla]
MGRGQIIPNVVCGVGPSSYGERGGVELIMLEMKLPMRTAEEGGGDTAEDEQEQTDCNVHIRGSVSQTAYNRYEDSARGLRFPHQLDKETVFEWFGLHLNPAKRIEFMCGLLHMCQPLELRFLGACLEDLARKDFHVLRDFEIRGNSPNDLGLLTDVVDPVVRSKLLVCLSLLGSENRECAGILFRILSRVDPALYFKNYGFPVSSCRDPQHLQFHPPCEDGDEYGKSDRSCGPPAEAGVGPLEQLALLFTMASLHPAFPFHQRENFRIQLDKVDVAIEEEEQNYQHSNSALGSGGCTCGCTSLPLHTSGTVHADKLQQNKVPKTDYLSPSTETSLSDRAQSLHPSQSPNRKSQREAVHIERIVLKGISRSREYSFEVKWSDASSSHVTKTHHDLENFLLKLPRELSTESFEKGILSLLRQGDKCESREVERTLKEKFLSAPQSFRQTGTVCGFFLSESSGPNYSRCNPVPVGKPFKEDCSEASSQEEGVYLEPYPQGHRKKPGSKSPSLSAPSAKGSQAETSRRAPLSEHTCVPDWRRKSSSLKPAHEACVLCPEQLYRGEVKGTSLPGNKTKVRAPVTDREKGKKMEGRLGYIPNGIMRAAPVQLLPQPSGKDLRLDVGSGPDTYGETSSESYSSPSSPRHDGRESLESEDEKDGDTDSHSDDSSKGKTGGFLPCKGVGGAAVATVRPLVPVPLKEVRSRLESSLSAPKVPQLAFLHPVPYPVQNGTAGPEGADGKAAGGSAAGGDAEKPAPDPSPLLPAFGAPLLGPQQPLVQRFRTAAPPPGSESCVTAALQPPVGAISFPPPGPAYPSPLQPAYPPAEPVISSGLPPSLPLAETHPKAPGLPLPSGLRPSYSLSVPTTVIPSVGALGGPAASQVQAMVPPVVPTHTPGPAPSPSPALTHSTAQSDSTSYINSTSCGSAGGASQQPQQQQQPTPSQQMGCGTCGCRGSCGSGHAPNYFFPPHMPRQVISVPPIFHLTSLCSSSYLNQAHQSNGATQLPFFSHGPSPYASAPPPPLLHSHSDHVLGTQTGYGLPQMAAFNRFYQPVYPSVSMMPGSSSSSMALGMKKNSNMSCYNCGVSGHFALDCKQPSFDAAQKGGFRLKFVPQHSSEALDNAD